VLANSMKVELNVAPFLYPLMCSLFVFLYVKVVFYSYSNNRATSIEINCMCMMNTNMLSLYFVKKREHNCYKLFNVSQNASHYKES